MNRRPLVAGNWKMNGLRAALGEIAAIGEAYDAALRAQVDLALCLPATLIAVAAEIAVKYKIALGGQDCHAAAAGPHTGDVSAEMLKDAGAAYVIVGHSERRVDHGETSADAQARAVAALRVGLTPIICVGETRAEREAGRAFEVVGAQIDGSIPQAAPDTIVLAYEPVWAIGTGLTASPEQAQQVHAFIRSRLAAGSVPGAAGARILYGGSVKPSNAQALFGQPDVDGGLIGGASLVAADFLSICRAAALRSIR